jgi:hypothetical protein
MNKIFASESTNYCFVPIGKNAHNWGKLVFRDHLDFVEQSWEHNLDKIYIIFLRDPIDRWLSGITQYIELLKFEGNESLHKFIKPSTRLDPLHIEFIFEHIGFDGHSGTQFPWVTMYQINPCVYFDVNNEHFVEQVQHFIQRKIKKNIKIPTHKVNDGSLNPLRQRLRDQLQNALENNPKYRTNLENYFKHDYEFINKCKFYTHYSEGL